MIGPQPSEEPIRESKPLLNAIFNNQLKELVDSRIYNHGLNSPHDFEFEGKMYHSEKVAVYDRRAFMAKAIEKSINNFAILDIVNLRQADMATDGAHGNKSADIILSYLSHTVVDYLRNFHQRNPGKKIEFCRYGGDEFAFSYKGMNQQEIVEFNQQIGLLFNKIEGFYKPQLTGSEVIKRQVEVEFKTIDRPQDEFSKAIFDHFLERGMILKTEEIERSKTRFVNLERFEKWQAEEMKLLSYPEKCKDISDKLRYLSNLNPLLKKQIDDLIKMADQLGEESQFKLKKDLEFIFFDPLLSSAILSTSDLMDNIVAGNISHVWTKDLKFIKQLNNISHTDGDNAIKILWQTIKESMPEADQEKIIFCKNGGTFLIALKNGEKLSSDTIAKLNGITSIHYRDMFTHQSLSFAIGRYDHEVDPAFVKNKYSEKQKLTEDEFLVLKKLKEEESKKLFDRSDDLFYKQIGGYFLSGNWGNVFTRSKTLVEELHIDSLLQDFFINKRAVQHIIGLERALDELIGSNRITFYETEMLRNLRLAMKYAYSHDMTNNQELIELRNILT